jgi:predicted RecB family nuclease
MRRVLTERIFDSLFDCTYKCHLLLNGRHGTKTEYEEHTERFNGIYQRAALARLQEINQDKEILYLNKLTPSVQGNAILDSGQLIIIKHVETNGLRSDSVVLAWEKNRNGSLKPLFFHRYEKLDARAKLLLAFRATIIEEITGTVPSHGQMISGPDFTGTAIPLSASVAKVKRMINRIGQLATQPDSTFFLCSHCEICEFRSSCHSRAVEEDSMSLLQGIGRSHIEEQNRKGIFTLHQYSHTFRPRRLAKRVKTPSKPRHFSLQARALRDNKVYIHGTPALPITGTSIYFDIEGIPGRGFYYLFGMLVVTEKGESYQYFWANDKSDEAATFLKFCVSAGACSSNAVLFHFGNYEAKAMKQMKRSIGSEHHPLVDGLLNSSYNVLPILHHHCYFPTFSNRLKDVAHFLGYQFNNQIHSGVGSIVFRERWEGTADHALKDELIAYNRQDCEALKKVCEFVRTSTALASAREHVSGRDEEVNFAESLRKSGEGNRPIFRKAQFLLPEFELVNKCAYFDYQRDRVFARTQPLPRSLRSQRAKKTERRISLATEISSIPTKCPACGSKRLIYEKRFVRWKIDLKYYKTEIGVKKWQPRYLVSKHRCLKCKEVITSPSSLGAASKATYGHGLMCWCVYHNIVGKQSMLSVHRGLKDIFNLHILAENTYRFKSILASYYNELSREILGTILKANVIHIDETPVKLRKTVGYVWVISSASEVYYFFKDTREASFLQDLLGAYQGILISDFFTAYDSIKCRQQKCLVHLMRDINDDLHKNPYDEEMRSIAQPFAKLLKEIVLTIDRYGLRRWHLHKYAKPAERLCAAIAEQHFTSTSASKYQSRFGKYGDRLFTFLSYDGVPWNNNNAEHAVHHFAKLRRITDGTFTRSSLEQLLVLLTVLQTCEYRKVNPLKFLLSARRQLCWMKDPLIGSG